MAYQEINKDELEIINSKINEKIDDVFEVIDVIYNDDKTKRFIILKENENTYSYRLEFLMKIDDDYKWNPPCCSMSHSIFISKKDAINDLKLTEAYEKYFIF